MMTNQYINNQLSTAQELIWTGQDSAAREIITKLITDLQAEKPVGLKD
jgi:hypothetical protein